MLSVNADWHPPVWAFRPPPVVEGLSVLMVHLAPPQFEAGVRLRDGVMLAVFDRESATDQVDTLSAVYHPQPLNEIHVLGPERVGVLVVAPQRPKVIAIASDAAAAPVGAAVMQHLHRRICKEVSNFGG